jgi:hypothetical protein
MSKKTRGSHRTKKKAEMKKAEMEKRRVRTWKGPKTNYLPVSSRKPRATWQR